MKSPIVTFGNLDFATDYALTAANFPALRHAILPSGISGLVLTDPIGGKTISCAAGWVQPAAGRFRAGGACTVAGSLWAAPGANASVFMAFGSFASSAIMPIQFGSAGQTTGVDLSAGTNAGVTVDATHYDTLAANGVITGVHSGVAMALPAGGAACVRYVTDDATNTTAGAVTHAIGISNLVIAESAAVTTNASSYLTGAFMFVFAALPTDIAAATAWMAANPGKGYPAWKGRV